MKRLTFAAAMLSATVLSNGFTAYAKEVTADASIAQPVRANGLFTVKTVSPGIREVSYVNPPLNFIVPEAIAELNKTIKDLSKDESVKVVVFTSGVDGFFINHFDIAQFPAFVAQVGADSKPLWVELVSNVESAPFITIASIRGRTQGGGDELTLAFDLRYASAERAVFNQPEVGIGLFPGGGGPEHLVRLAGRDRALEAFLSADDYDAATAERFGWVTRSMPDAELDKFVSTMAQRLSTFDKTALVEVKKHINAISLPTEADRIASNVMFMHSLSWPGLQPRMEVFGQTYQELGPMEVEANMGRYVGEGNQRLQDHSK